VTAATIGGEEVLGGGEQLAAFAGPFVGQERVAAGDEAFAGVVGVGDLGEVVLVEQGRLQRSAGRGQGLDGRGAQRGQPAQVRVAVGAERVDAGRRDHAAVADQHRLGEREPVPHDLDRVDEGGRVGGVAGEHLDRYRAALGVGEQPVLDLGPVLLPVAGVAALGERAVPAFHPRRGQVEQRHPVWVHLRREMAFGELGLDRVLTAQQPIHRRIGLIGRRARNVEVGPERGVVPPGGRGQLRGRVHDPGDDQRRRQVPLPPGRAEQARQIERCRLGPHRRDMPVRHGPGDRGGLVRGHQAVSLQPGLDPVDHVRGQRRQVRHRLVADLAAVAERPPQIRRGVVATVPLPVHVRLPHSDYVDRA